MSIVIGLMLASSATGSDKGMADAVIRIENSIAILLEFLLVQEATIEAKQARVNGLLKEIELIFASIGAYQEEIDYYKNIRNSNPAIVDFRAQLQRFDAGVPDQDEDELL